MLFKYQSQKRAARNSQILRIWFNNKELNKEHSLT